MNLIALVVNDGLAASTNTVAVTVLTTGQAVERLIALVNESDLRHKRPLLATLEAALVSIQRGNCHAAAGQLHAFQNKVRTQVSSRDSDLAMELTGAANQVIAALDCDGSTRVAAKIHSLKRHADGSLQLRIEGKVGQVYVVEASTNLVHWETVGTANLKGDGSIEFEDPDALKHQRRFYRVVEP